MKEPLDIRLTEMIADRIRRSDNKRLPEPRHPDEVREEAEADINAMTNLELLSALADLAEREK